MITASEHITRFQDCLSFLKDNFHKIPEHVQPKFMQIYIQEQSNKEINGDLQSWCFAIKHLIEIRNSKKK